MLSLCNDQIKACERMLAKSVLGLANELRIVDAGDMVGWLRCHRFGNLASLVSSSTELMFKPNTLRFSLSGDAELTWSGRMAVGLDMEFHHDCVDCYFRLHLDETCAGVDITYLSINGGPCTSPAHRERFAAALADATVGPRGQGGPARHKVAGRKRKFGAKRRK